MGNSIVGPLIGVAVGHGYFFVIDILPISYGYSIVKTPKLCVDVISWITRTSVPTR